MQRAAPARATAGDASSFESAGEHADANRRSLDELLGLKVAVDADAKDAANRVLHQWFRQYLNRRPEKAIDMMHCLTTDGGSLKSEVMAVSSPPRGRARPRRRPAGRAQRPPPGAPNRRRPTSLRPGLFVWKFTTRRAWGGSFFQAAHFC